jgi:hypothetical protein
MALMCLAMLGSACAAADVPPSPNDVLSPGDAVEVVQQYWQVNERAAMGADADLFERVQTGALLEADRGVVLASRALGRPGTRAPRPLRRVTPMVPHQRRYPAQFLALIETVVVADSGEITDQASGFYDHFVKPSQTQGWMADFYVPADLRHPVRFAIDPSGYATGLTPGAEGFVLRPGEVPGAFARYLTSGLATGRPDGPFGGGHLTTEAVDAQRRYRDAMRAGGYGVAFEFAPRTFIQAYRGAGGEAVLLFAVDATLRIGAACIVQPADDPRRWGGLVAPGAYSSLVLGHVLELMASDPPRSTARKVEISSSADDLVSSSTRPAPAGCR